MKPQDFLKIAKYQLNKFGLHHWNAVINNTLDSLGLCDFESCTISFLLTGDDDEDLDTVMHEVAHAIAAERDGCFDHSTSWLKWSAILGVNTERWRSNAISNK